MQHSCEFSFVIPTRNEGPALAETLRHLQRFGPHDPYEIILIDDASETPFQIPDDLRGPVIFHRSDWRQGVARSGNVGASLATGRVLVFLDAHVCFAPDSLAALCRSDVAEARGIRGCATRRITDFDQFVALARRESGSTSGDVADRFYGWSFTLDPLPDVIANPCALSHEPFCVPYVGACALAISRELFHDLGSFDDGLRVFGSLGDAELAMRCWSFGYDVRLIPEAICCHYYAPDTRVVTESPAGWSALDDKHHEGALLNALRVLYLHFPARVFQEILQRVRSLCAARGISLLPIWESAEVQSRRAKIDARRTRSREWLVDRLTRLSEVPTND